jgi:hypothetical protein
MTVCEECQRAMQTGRGEAVEVSPEVVAMARCDAQILPRTPVGETDRAPAGETDHAHVGETDRTHTGETENAHGSGTKRALRATQTPRRPRFGFATRTERRTAV